MSRNSLRLGWIFSALMVIAPACGGEEAGDEERNESESETFGAKADSLPVWLKHLPLAWGCDQTLMGKFVGWDSAHMYSFPGKYGYEYTFSFKATYPKSKGAVIAVYDSTTGKRVAYKRQSASNQVSVVYKAEKSIKYLVAVYSVSVYATGSYTLAAACKVVEVTCQHDAACAKGQFCKFASGCGKSGLGVCATTPTACTMEYAPVCGCNGQTYGNKCQAAAAAVSVDHVGECEVVTKQALLGIWKVVGISVDGQPLPIANMPDQTFTFSADDTYSHKMGSSEVVSTWECQQGQASLVLPDETVAVINQESISRITISYSLKQGGVNQSIVIALDRYKEDPQPQTKLPEWLPGNWTLTHHTMTHAGQTSQFPAGTGVIQVATALTFTQDCSTYDYSGGPVPTGKGEIKGVDGKLVSIQLWPTTVASLPATVAEATAGIVVEFTADLYADGPSLFSAYYAK